jgi:hypothetical protein
LSALFDGEAESDQTAEDKVMTGLQALKRARSDVGTVIETKLPEESSESDDDVTYETIKPVKKESMKYQLHKIYKIIKDYYITSYFYSIISLLFSSVMVHKDRNTRVCSVIQII